LKAPEFFALIDYDEIASNYSKHRQVHPGVLKELLLSGGVTAEAFRTLEVGCGTGNYITAFKKHTACCCLGVEPSEQMLSIAEKRFEDVIYYKGTLEQLNLPKDFFDLVFSVDVIHYLNNCLGYFEEVHRIL